MDPNTAEWMPFAVALGIGLLIGAERERRMGQGSTRGAAGIRTFTVTSLLGATAMQFGSMLLLATLAAGLTVLATAAYMRPNQDPGLTTEASLLATFLLGALAVTNASLAAALGVSLAVLLAARTQLHRFVLKRLGQAELIDTLVLAASALVILPVLPDHPVDPLGAINPHTIWRFAVLMMVVSAAGHIAQRIWGSRIGLPVAGLLGGFVSGIATISAMGHRAVSAPQHRLQAAAAAVLSTVATMVQLVLIIGVVHEPVLPYLAIPLACGTFTAIACAAIVIWRAVRTQTRSGAAIGRPIDLKVALILTVTIALLLLASAILSLWLGATGILIAAILGGFADTHSAAASVAVMAAQGRLSDAAAAAPILAAFTSNAVMKGVAAIGSGKGPFARIVIPGLVVVTASVWIGYLLRQLFN